MILVDDVLISEEILDLKFCCDLSACKGACCIEGDGGAPLEEDEKKQIERDFKKIKPFLTEDGLAAIHVRGKTLVDEDGDCVTPLIGESGPCAYVVYDENGIAGCGIEKAWQQGKTTLRKPVSCHLYPIRISRQRVYTALNYHQWQICKPALRKGNKLNIALPLFVEDALRRKFGESWLHQFNEMREVYAAEKNK